MASAKDTFEANTWEANTFAAGAWRGVEDPSTLVGPWRVAAMQAATSGAIIGEAAVPGAQAAEAGTSGAIIAEGVDHG